MFNSMNTANSDEHLKIERKDWYYMKIQHQN